MRIWLRAATGAIVIAGVSLALLLPPGHASMACFA
jgi:hypothetical protein